MQHPLVLASANTGEPDTMKADSQGHRAIVPDKLRQFLTNLAAIHSGGRPVKEEPEQNKYSSWEERS